jgi:hypothetical protein
MCRIFWSSYSTFILPTLVGDDLVPTPGPPFFDRPMKANGSLPAAQSHSAPTEDSHLALPRPTGGGGLCSYACGALTCLIGSLTCLMGTGRSITWPRAAARHGRSTGSSLLDNQIRSARLVCPDSFPFRHNPSVHGQSAYGIITARQCQ